METTNQRLLLLKQIEMLINNTDHTRSNKWNGGIKCHLSQKDINLRQIWSKD